MKSIFLVASGMLLGIGVLSCTPDNSNAFCKNPSGWYVNTTVLEKCPGTMPADVPHFCFEFWFTGKGTIITDNGVEMFELQYERTMDGCTYRIKGDSTFNDLTFSIEQDSSILLYDTAWTKLSTPSHFERLNTSNPGSTRFWTRINECMIAGTYDVRLGDNSVSEGWNVEVLPGGIIKGLLSYRGYDICFVGDCLEVTDPPARTIDLIDRGNDRHTFVFKPNSDNRMIEFFSVGDRIPGKKGGRTIVKKEFTLTRI